jgi:hypothetical protein
MTSTPNIPSAGAWSSSDGAGTGAPETNDPSVITTTTGAVLPSGFGESSDTGFPRAAEFSSTQDAGTMSEVRPVSAPILYLYSSMLAVLVALILAAMSSSIVLGVLAWLLSVVLGLGLAMVFVVKNTARQASPWYDNQPFPMILYRVSIAASIVGIIAASARIALFVGRM